MGVVRHLIPLLLIPAVALSAAPDPPAPTLSVLRPTLHHRQEDGPLLPQGYQYYSGELLYLSFRIGGFKVQKDKVDLRWQVVAVDPEGLLLAAAASGAIREEVSFNDKDWLPKIQYTLALPAQIPPGNYKLKIRVADEFANSSADKELDFQVGGKPFPKVSEFTILDLRFYRSEIDREGMDSPIYHPGEPLLAKFRLAGYQLGEKNRFDVEYGISILSPTGKLLYTQPEAASQSAAPFYPQRLLNGAATLNTDTVQPAEYTLVLKARDRIAGKNVESSLKFKVEK